MVSRGDGHRFPQARILVFAKAPVPGACKTRLIPALGAAGAAALHAELLEATLQRLATADLAPLQLWCAPDAGAAPFPGLAERFGVALHTQRGAGLGERLLHAATEALTRAQAVVLVGCDCPSLGPAQVTATLRALLHAPRRDAVLGPADDGGYVLLGLRRAAPELFTAMPWGGDGVAAMTRARMAGLGWRWLELGSLPDLDRPEDLDRYRPRARV